MVKRRSGVNQNAGGASGAAEYTKLENRLVLLA
jgi:hypothetical protein